MQICDAVIVGGGPAGSTCAWALRRAGARVVVADKAEFPRDKVCAGWLTPGTVAALELDVDEYRRGRTWQPFSGMCVGLIDGPPAVEVAGHRPVGYGVRRLELDDYLLRRAGARLLCGAPLASVERLNGEWVINASLVASVLVGAGGHGCPVARRLNGPSGGPAADEWLVVAQEAEFAMTSEEASVCRVDPEVPEVYFCRDLNGYGWCVRKGQYLNVGIGRLDRHSLPSALAGFTAFLTRTRRTPVIADHRWRGHAYLLRSARSRRIVDDGVVLIGDAAGLAYPISGEGIGPAVVSALLAAQTIAQGQPPYGADVLQPYAAALDRQFPTSWLSQAALGWITPRVAGALAPVLLRSPQFVRAVVINRWFVRPVTAPPAVPMLYRPAQPA